MLVLILKSSACLAVFMLFYKLLLEKESFHQFKRFYLLGALVVAMVIPFITFTQYIEVEPIQNFVPFQPLGFSTTEPLIFEEAKTWQDYIPTALWSLYFLGVALFSFRFALNLKTIFNRIKNNPKHQYHEFTNVLLQDLIHPHTFFKYIFLNKTKYEHNLIPNEVLLHEQTHAKQKHALDILCIEILQIIFWFNPLLYFIKKDIKLNHEFLADQAVLQKGIDSTTYKQTLLAFSSDANEPQLVNTFNYSSSRLINLFFTKEFGQVKKRFNVMTSKTSKQAIWLRSLILLPILAILIYSFSQKEVVEKEVAVVDKIQEGNRRLTIKTNLYNFLIEKREEAEKALDKSKTKDSSELKLILGRIDAVKNDIDKSINDNNNSIEERLNVLQQQKATPEQIAEYNNLAKKYNTLLKKGEDIVIKPSAINALKQLYNLMTDAQKKNAEPFPDFPSYPPPPPKKTQIKNPQVNDVLDVQQKATPKQVASYNAWAKTINTKLANGDDIIVKQKEIEKFKHIHSIMSETQRKSSEPFPNFPPPPPPPPVPANATPAQKEKYKKAIKEYRIAVEKAAKAEADVIRVMEVNDAEKVKIKRMKEQIAVERKVALKERQAEMKLVKEKMAEQRKLQAKEGEVLREQYRSQKIDEREAKVIQEKLREVEKRHEQADRKRVEAIEKRLKETERRQERIAEKREAAMTERLQEVDENDPNYPYILAEYNTLAEKITKRIKRNGPLKRKDVERLKYLYSKIPESQKKNYAADFPSIPPPPPPPIMDTISTYNSLAIRTKFIPNNRNNNLQHLKTLFNKMSDFQKEKVENPNSISNYIAQLNKLSAAQIKQVKNLYNKIKANAQSKGRKFYSAAEYKELEKLYSSMLSSNK
jgi:beta-lactamase regulating signal transducer with metallopeptidase domain